MDEYLRSKLPEQQPIDSEAAAAEASAAVQREREKRASELAAALEAEVPMPPSVVGDDDDGTADMLASTADAVGGDACHPHPTETVVLDDPDDEPLHPSAHYGDEDDEEEREAEARTAGSYNRITMLPCIISNAN